MNLFGKLNQRELEQVSENLYKQKIYPCRGEKTIDLDIPLIENEIKLFKFQLWDRKVTFYEQILTLFAILAYLIAILLIAQKAMEIAGLLLSVPMLLLFCAMCQGDFGCEFLEFLEHFFGITFICSIIVFLIVLPIYTITTTSILLIALLTLRRLRKRGIPPREEEVENFILPTIAKNASIYLTHKNEKVRKCAYKLLEG